MLLAPILQPMIAGSDELGSYELDLMAREVARDDRSGFAALVSSATPRCAMMEATERDAYISALLPRVRALARRLKRIVPNLDLDDLTGDGFVGLIRAVDSFDPARGPHLDEYARRLIVGAMLNGIRRMDPVSERARRIVRDGENERYTLAAASGEIPSLAEMERCRPGYQRALRQRTEASRSRSMRRYPSVNRSRATGATIRRESSNSASSANGSSRSLPDCRRASVRS